MRPSAPLPQSGARFNRRTSADEIDIDGLHSPDNDNDLTFLSNFLYRTASQANCGFLLMRLDSLMTDLDTAAPERKLSFLCE